MMEVRLGKSGANKQKIKESERGWKRKRQKTPVDPKYFFFFQKVSPLPFVHAHFIH